MKSNISIIVSTYNSPEWLEKVLIGFMKQTYNAFELLIADDGSTRPTFEVIEKMQSLAQFPIRHVWHADHGFQKTIILNKALVQAQSDYILMTDGDCIPRKDFVEVHMRARKPDHFLSGGYHKLPMVLSKKITKEDILSENCFDVQWLLQHGMKSSFKNQKLTKNSRWGRLLNGLTTTKPSWNGHNASAWTQDMLSVNGFDERMAYGGEDREFGERLENNGIKGIQIRYSTTCLHLDHARGYVNQEAIAVNEAIRKATLKNKTIWTPFGIQKELK